MDFICGSKGEFYLLLQCYNNEVRLRGNHGIFSFDALLMSLISNENNTVTAATIF